jgi:hypothetical protein
MRNFFALRAGPGRFRVRWCGYDRAEVDAFLRRTAIERQKLQEDLAQLEVVMAGHGEERRRELDRLTALRAEVASCLEASIGALRTATERLAVQAEPDAPQPDWPPVAKDTALDTAFHAAARRIVSSVGRWCKPARARVSDRRVRAGIAAGLMLIPAVFMYRSSAREVPAAAAGQPVHFDDQSTTGPHLTSVSAVQRPGVVLTLTGKRDCWLSMRLDGGQPLEHLLKTNETIMLRANEEAILRVGDAAALSMLINNEVAKPLGGSGQVVTTRITRDNYRGFLAGI